MKNESKIVFGGMIIILIIIITGAVFSSLLTEEIKNMSVKRTEVTSSSFIISLTDHHLVPTDFKLDSLDEKRVTFEQLFHEIHSGEMLKIKV